MDSAQASKVTEQIWHQRTEQLLLEAITQGEYPFLGLYGSAFSENARDYLSKNIKLKRFPIKEYIEGLQKWPAIYACYLTLHVVESYGDDSGRSVYPAVSRAVAATDKELSTREKEALWFAYRTACIKLGLAVSARQSGSNYMINEYLQQGGVPVNYVENLAQRMIKHASKVGLPSTDDPQAIVQWTASFANKLKKPVSITVKGAIDHDENGFYLQLFLKLLANPDTHNSSSDIESAMLRAINNSTGSTRLKSSQLSIPRLLWLGQELEIELPAGESHSWEIKLDEETFFQSGQYDIKLIPLENILHKIIEIVDLNSALRYDFSLWPDDKNNRLLVFSDKGGFIARGQLGNSANLMELEPGQYQLITRFKPKGKEDVLENIADDPELYRLFLSLEPGEHFNLERGPASITLKADSKPYILFKGESFQDIKGHEIYASSSLKIAVKIPDDYRNQLAHPYVLRLIPGELGDAIEILIDPDNYSLEWDILPFARHWKAGAVRLLAEIKRQDIARPIVRSSILLWNGLDKVEDGSFFYCNRPPENLLLDESENIKVFADYVTNKDNGSRFFRLCFNLKANKKIYFTGYVAGICILLKAYSADGVSERVLQKNTTLTVNALSRSVIEIFSSTPGILQLGRFTKVIGRKNKIVRLHLSSLVEYLTPEFNELHFTRIDSATAEPLLKLVTPHEILYYKVDRQPDYLCVSLSLASPVQIMRFTAINVLTGLQFSQDLIADDLANLQDSNHLAYLSTASASEEGAHYLIEYPVKNWDEGAWLINLDVKINNRWGFLCNARQDHYVASLLIDEQKRAISDEELKKIILFLPDKALLPVLRCVHKALLTCYAQVSWDAVSWLKDVWIYIVNRCHAQDGELLLETLALAAKYPPDVASSGWVPILSLGSALPWIFSRPVRSYTGFGHRKENLLLTFKVFEKLDNGVTMLLKNADIDPVIVGAFLNAPAVMQGEEPKNFNMGRYVQSLNAQDITNRKRLLLDQDWQPGLGDFLGALHYQWAVKKFQGNYLRTSLGNDLRRTTGLGMIKSCSRDSVFESFNATLPDSFQRYSLGLMDGLCEDDCALLNDEMTQLRENYLDIILILSVFSQVCRQEVSHPGIVDKFIRTLSRKAKMDLADVEGSIGYLLFIGEDVFSFYLLLWEIIFQTDGNRNG